MGGIVKAITKPIQKIGQSIFGIDPDAQNGAIAAAANTQAQAVRDAATTQANAAKAASDAAVQQANQQAAAAQDSTNAAIAASTQAMANATNQQNLKNNLANESNKVDNPTVDLTGDTVASDDDLNKKRNPRAGYTSAAGGTGIRLT